MCSRRRSAGLARCSGISSPRISRARSTRAPAATAARAERRRLASSKLASRFGWRGPRADPALLPGHQRLVGAEPGEQRADRVAVRTRRGRRRDLAGLGRDAEAAGDADERERGLGAGAGHLERRRTAGLGQRAVGEEGAAPGRVRVAAAAGDDRGGRPRTGRPRCRQAGLAGQRLAVLDYPDDVAAALADAVALDHHDVGLVAVDLGDVACAAGGPRRRCRARPRPRCCPLTMCRPPANRSIAATSALRQQVLVIWVLASSAFTCAVIAMGRSCHAGQPPSPGTVEPPAQSVIQASSTTCRNASAQPVGVVPLSPGDGDVGDHQTGFAVGHVLLQPRLVGARDRGTASTSTAWTVRSGACSTGRRG